MTAVRFSRSISCTFCGWPGLVLIGALIHHNCPPIKVVRWQKSAKDLGYDDRGIVTGVESRCGQSALADGRRTGEGEGVQ